MRSCQEKAFFAAAVIRGTPLARYGTGTDPPSVSFHGDPTCECLLAAWGVGEPGYPHDSMEPENDHPTGRSSWMLQ